ncbi:hypothetical protein BT69DRAFT_1349690 [Atractiella rhizophila]|nr:hypothetical protein BT69DRAFT_1349690 [Atractiella rhizophila]
MFLPRAIAIKKASISNSAAKETISTQPAAGNLKIDAQSATRRPKSQDETTPAVDVQKTESDVVDFSNAAEAEEHIQEEPDERGYYGGSPDVQHQSRLGLQRRRRRGFPEGVIVHLSHLSTSTNREKMKKLIERSVDGVKVEYVDLTKGLDRCHIRLETTEQARRLVDWLGKHRVVHQLEGDDWLPLNEDFDEEAMVKADLIVGRREELYWSSIRGEVKERLLQRDALS